VTERYVKVCYAGWETRSLLNVSSTFECF